MDYSSLWHPGFAEEEKMDINILLALQDFRNGAGAFLAGFFSKMTWLGELNTALIIMALLYWCVSKDFGAYLLMGWSGNRLVNGMLKVTVCAYRPWIRDARVVPYGYDERGDRIWRRCCSKGPSPGAAHRAGPPCPACGIQP